MLTQPNRFLPVAFLFLCLPAAIGTGLFINGVRRRRGLSDLLAVGLAAPALAIVCIVAWEIGREISYADHGHYGAIPPEVQGPGQDTQLLTEWLAAHTTPDARVLFEVTNGRFHDDGHVAGYLAREAQREFIGGPYPNSYSIGFFDGLLFERPIGSFTANEFVDLQQTYNIGWVITTTHASEAFFTDLDAAQLLERGRGTALFALNGSPSYFVEGQGRISERDWNRLRLSGLSGDAVTIKYHYHPRLSSEPPTAIGHTAPNAYGGSFIRIESPPEELVLSFR
jgi:hypothetical protein